jgi:phosphoglycerate dehydrogenase-like enzyme
VTVVSLPSEELRELAAPLPDGVTSILWDTLGAPPADVAEIEFLVPQYDPTPVAADVLARLPRLRVIQLLSAGFDPWLSATPAGVTLCNARGVHGASTAELAVMGISAALRDLPTFYDQQRRHEWSDDFTDGLPGRRVLVLGAGDIGERIATAVVAFGASATLVGRSARTGVHAIAELPALLPEHDVVAIALPLDDSTRHLVDAAFLAALPDGAVVANVARGGIVDTDALLVELTTQRLRGFLDVTDPEPLPPDHPLWDAPNLIITPHIGGGTTGWIERAARLARDQIARFVAGEPLQNIVRD